MPAYYSAMLSEFIRHSEAEIIGALTIENSKSRFPLEVSQIEAWREQLPELQAAARYLISKHKEANYWSLLLEYPIPRIGLRIDAVLLTGSDILVMEFKTGAGSTG